MKTELLPCPFCGEEPNFNTIMTTVFCVNVLCANYSHAIPLKSWNTRMPTPSPTVAEVEKICSCFGSFRPCNPNCPCGNADATGACVACGKNLEVGDSNPPPASVDFERIAEKCLDRLFGYNKEPAWIRAIARMHNEAVIKSAILESTDHLQSKVEELKMERDDARMIVVQCDRKIADIITESTLIVQERDTLKQQLTSARDELHRQRNICIHHTDKEFGQLIGKCPVCTQQQLAEAEKDSERSNERLIEWMMHMHAIDCGCFTGDCPHTRACQCHKSLLEMFNSDEAIANSTKKGQE